MKKNLHWILLAGIVLLFVIVFSVTKTSGKQAPESLSVQASPSQVGPQVIAQNPVAGQRLGLSPTIQITFDRDMNQDKTGKAFSFLGADNKRSLVNRPGATLGHLNSHQPLNSNLLQITPEFFLHPQPRWMAHLQKKILN